jgi:hypothetical protein
MSSKTQKYNALTSFRQAQNWRRGESGLESKAVILFARHQMVDLFFNKPAPLMMTGESNGLD